MIPINYTRFDDESLDAAAWYLDIEVAGRDVGEVEIDPVVVMAGLSFRF